MLEIRFHGRGGHGVKTAAMLLAEAFIRKKGYFVQAFPEFGPERRGAPVKSFVRIDESPILTHESVTNPDIVVVLDDSLDHTEFVEGLDNKDILLINSRRKDKFKFDVRTYAIDATAIALEILGSNIVNTIMLASLAAVANLDILEELKDVVRAHLKQKKGEEMAEKNIRAMEIAYHGLKK